LDASAILAASTILFLKSQTVSQLAFFDREFGLAFCCAQNCGQLNLLFWADHARALENLGVNLADIRVHLIRMIGEKTQGPY
jgi:hypothetical protein